MTYIALIGDVIDSKRLKDRSRIQKQLFQLLEQYNDRYQNDLVSPFTITTGDEFQALFKANPSIFEMIDQIRYDFLPHQIRFGIGVGEIVTDINPNQSIGADGPAYWRARSAIDYIHEKHDYGVNHIAVSLADETLTQTINAIIAGCSFIESKWTNEQEEAFQVLLQERIYDENFSNKDLANSLDLNPSAMTKRIKASGIKIYLRNKKVAMKLLLEAMKEEV